MNNINGLNSSTDVSATGDPNSNFFIRKNNPIIVDVLIANEVITEEINLNSGVLTTAAGGTILTLNGNPVGGGTLDAITGVSPILITGTPEDAIISLANSGVVAGTYTVAEITVDSKGLITSAASGIIPPNDDWSTFPAVSVINANSFAFQNLLAPFFPNDAANKSYVDILDDQNVKRTGNQSVAGVKTFSSLPLSSVVPTLPSQLVNKAYVDASLPGADPLNVVLATGNSAGSNEINMNSNKIVNLLNPTDAQDACTKDYVDTLPAPAVPTLNQVLVAGNIANVDIDMNGFDLRQVNDITMTGLLPSITATNALGNLTITSSATMNLGTIGQMTLASGGILSLGGATYTTIENLRIDNSVITKETSTPDLTISNVASIGNTGQLSITGTPVLINGEIVNTTSENLTAGSTTSATTTQSVLTTAGNYTIANGTFTGQTKLITVSSSLPKQTIPFFSNGKFNTGSSVQCSAYDSVNDILYFGGNFLTTPDGVRRDRVAMYSGVTGLFYGTPIVSPSALPGISNGTVITMTLIGSVLYVGGSFSNVGGVSGFSRIAAWTITGLGTGSWSTLSATVFPNQQVNAFALAPSNELYIGGSFTALTGQAGTNVGIVRLNISTGVYTSVLGGVVSGGTVNSLFYDSISDRVYVGGLFASIGGNTNSSCFSYYDITANTFNALGNGVVFDTGVVLSITRHSNDIIIGGTFFNAVQSNGDIVNISRVAAFNLNTSQWSAIGGGFNSEVRGVNSISGNLYAAGAMTTTGDGFGSFKRVCIYNSVNDMWEPISGASGTVNEIYSKGADIYFLLTAGQATFGNVTYDMNSGPLVIVQSRITKLNAISNNLSFNGRQLSGVLVSGNDNPQTMILIWNTSIGKWDIINNTDFLVIPQ